jgi:hypothetical protein
VKLGFIVEGDTEKLILDRTDFFSYLKEQNIEFVPDIINVVGKNNLEPEKISPFSEILKDKGANKIIILTDLDLDVCITKTKERVSPQEGNTVVVSVKQIESWFLADTNAMRRLLSDEEFEFNDPESVNDPFNTIRDAMISKTGRGVPRKLLLANKMIGNQFSILNAAQNPQCKSAAYFIEKIKSLTAQS